MAPPKPRPNRSPRAGGDEGFVLLEMLIAFAIAILAVGLMIAATSDAVRGAVTAARYQEATVRAQSRLAAAADNGKPALGERDGDDGGGFRWHERVLAEQTDTGRSAGEAAPPLTLYGITVWITWRDGMAAKSVTLETKRLGPPP
jgi:general secretion pathway protein I